MNTEKYIQIRTKLNMIIREAYIKWRNTSPIDTGLLRYEAIKIEGEGSDNIKIFIDLNISPYAVYLDNYYPGWWGQLLQNIIDEIKKQITII